MFDTLFLRTPLSLAHWFLAAAGLLCLAISCSYGVLAAAAVAWRRLEPSTERSDEPSPEPLDPALAFVSQMIAELPSLPIDVLVNALHEFMRHEMTRMHALRMLKPWIFPFLFISSSLPLAFVGFALSFTEPFFHQVGLVLLIVSVYARFILHRFSEGAGGAAGRGGLWFLPLRDLLVLWVWCRVCFSGSLQRPSQASLPYYFPRR